MFVCVYACVNNTSEPIARSDSAKRIEGTIQGSTAFAFRVSSSEKSKTICPLFFLFFFIRFLFYIVPFPSHLIQEFEEIVLFFILPSLIRLSIYIGCIYWLVFCFPISFSRLLPHITTSTLTTVGRMSFNDLSLTVAMTN